MPESSRNQRGVASAKEANMSSEHVPTEFSSRAKRKGEIREKEKHNPSMFEAHIKFLS